MVALACAALLVTAGAGAAKKKKAELVVASLDDPPAALAAGQSLTVSDKVKNRRGKAKRSANAYFLSVDEFRDLADVQLGTRKVPKLRAKKSSRGSADLTVPGNTFTGTYRLLACADFKKKVKERSESNNCRASKGTVTVAGVGPPDTAPPETPVITDTDPNPPASESQVAVRGNAEPGSTVRIYPTGNCSGAPIGSDSAGSFAFTGISVTVPLDTTTNLRATATDAAGNVSGCSAPFAYTHDGSLPAAPTITTVPASPSSDSSPEVRGTAEAGTTVRIYRSANCSGPAVASVDPATYAAGVTVTVPGNQTSQLSVNATDSAGNVSGCSATAYTHDSIAPPTPTITGTTPPSPSSDTTPQVRGTAQADSTVGIYTNGSCSGGPNATGSAAQFGGGGITVTVPAEQTTQLSARATDAAGNTSGCSASVSYTHDVAGPAAPTITDTDPDSPSSDNTPQVKGVGAESGSLVRIYFNSTCSGSPSAFGSAAQFEGGGITVTVPENQTTILTASVLDGAGNPSGCSGSFTYVEDSTAPGAPTITGTDPASPADDTTPQVQGTAEAGSTVSVYTDGTCSTPVAATGSAAQFGGAGIEVTVADGLPTTLTARATDAAGNASGCSAPVIYTELVPI